MFLSLSTTAGRDVEFNSLTNWGVREGGECAPGSKAAKDPVPQTRHTEPASTCDLHQHQCNRAAGQIFPALTAWLEHLQQVAETDGETKWPFAKMVSCQ